MRGDPQVDLPGVVLVGRRFVRDEGIELIGEPVTITGVILRISSVGLTVIGPKPDVVHNVLWQRVKSLEFGENTIFEDGSPARSIDVELDDRKVSFLVPGAVLSGERRRMVNEITRSQLGLSSDTGLEADTRPSLEDAVPAPEGAAPARYAVPRPDVVAQESMVQQASEVQEVLLPPPPPRSNLVMPPAPRDAGESSALGADLSQMNGIPPMNGNAKAPARQAPMFLLPLAVPPARRVEPPRLPPPPPQGSWLQEPTELTRSPSAGDPSPVSVPSVGPTATSATSPPFRLERPTPAAQTPRPTPTNASSRDHRRPRTTSVVGAGLALVLVLAGGAVFGLSVTGHGAATPTTGSTLGPSTLNSSGGETGGLNGPASGADARTVAGGLNIVAAGALKGWQVGTAPWPRIATSGADASLARCLAIPVSHIGALVGTSQPGGPSVYASGWITRGSPSTGIESSVELNQSVVTQQSDIATLDGSGATSCLQGWFASLDASDDAIVGIPSVRALDVSAEAGEGAAGFSVSVSTRSGGTLKKVDEQLVVLGAGRVEVGLVSESIGAFVSQALEATEVTGLENRLRAVAGS